MVSSKNYCVFVINSISYYEFLNKLITLNTTGSEQKAHKRALAYWYLVFDSDESINPTPDRSKFLDDYYCRNMLRMHTSLEQGFQWRTFYDPIWAGSQRSGFLPHSRRSSSEAGIPQALNRRR